MAGYKVLITTSGLGSRLGDITKYTNKSLVRIGKKPAISYIIEHYPKDVEIVITLGHYGNQVKEFINMAYPNRKFTFIDVKNYEGPGSSLGYSILRAQEALHTPFYFHACDSIISNKLPLPTLRSSCGGFDGGSSDKYRTYCINGNTVEKLNDKGEIYFDYSYIGVCGIKEYKLFWKHLNLLYKNSFGDGSLNDCDVINCMIEGGIEFESVECKNWLDIGNSDDLKNAREKIYDKFEILDKNEESIFIFDDSVIKFFNDICITKNRVERNKKLGNLVPKLIDYGENFYKYEYVKGDLYSHVVDEENFEDFLVWCDVNLWHSIEGISDFKEMCYDFYIKKTHDRLNSFYKQTSIIDKVDIINGVQVEKTFDLLSRIDIDELCGSSPSQFHGDFILDNIIKQGSEFVLLDWRQDFGGSVECGDIYYDFAKLNHNLIFNHDIVNKNLFEIKNIKDGIFCNILRSDLLVQCQKKLFAFLENNGYNSNKVEMLTAIIWLNMSALHHYPLNKFLYYFGKLNLHRSMYE